MLIKEKNAYNEALNHIKTYLEDLPIYHEINGYELYSNAIVKSHKILGMKIISQIRSIIGNEWLEPLTYETINDLLFIIKFETTIKLSTDDFTTISLDAFNQAIEEHDGGNTYGTLEDINDDLYEVESNDSSYTVEDYFKVEGREEYVMLTN